MSPLFSREVCQSETTVFQSWLIRVIDVGSGSPIVVKYEKDLNDGNSGFACLSLWTPNCLYDMQPTVHFQPFSKAH